MFFDYDKLFTIGQFAKLHEINKKTLMWYDEIGILKPAMIKPNGYRYYTYQQSFILETILLLRELNMSLPEIQHFLNDRSALSLENLLTEKIEELDNTMSHLKAIRGVMNEKRQNMSRIRTLDMSCFEIIEKQEEHYLVTVPTTIDTPFEKEIEMILNETKKYHLHRLHDVSYGSMLSVENLYNSNFDDYSFLYIELPVSTHRRGLHIQPKGKYLRTFYKGDWDNISNRYEEILAYAKQHNLQFSGFAYEKGINELVIDNLDDYITQIEIRLSQSH